MNKKKDRNTTTTTTTTRTTTTTTTTTTTNNNNNNNNNHNIGNILFLKVKLICKLHYVIVFRKNAEESSPRNYLIWLSH